MRRRVLVTLVVAVVVAAAAAVFLMRSESPREQLIARYSELSARPVALRLTGFPDTPPPGPTRGTSEETSSPASLRLQSVESAILAEPSASDRHTVALAQL